MDTAEKFEIKEIVETEAPSAKTTVAPPMFLGSLVSSCSLKEGLELAQVDAARPMSVMGL